jgi:hypothetical protein
MHINSLPVELFVQILNHVSSGDDINVMLVNRMWYREYQALIRRQAQARFEEILFSSIQQKFIVNKLSSFCGVFNDMGIYARFLKTRTALEKEMEEKDKDRMEVDRLMDEFEKSLEYDSWFPDWLWKMHKNTPYNTDCKWKIEHVNAIWKECETKMFERLTGNRRSQYTLSYRASGR